MKVRVLIQRASRAIQNSASARRIQLYIYRSPISRQSRLHDRLRHRGMRMRSLADLGGRRLERLAEHDLRNDVSRAVSDNLASDHFAVLLGRDEFHEAGGLANRDRLADRTKRELADLHFDAARLGPGLAEPPRRTFRLAVEGGGDRERVKAGLAHPRHDF